MHIYHTPDEMSVENCLFFVKFFMVGIAMKGVLNVPLFQGVVEKPSEFFANNIR